MPSKANYQFDASRLRAELGAHGHDLEHSIGSMFEGLYIYIDRPKHASTDILKQERPSSTAPLDLRLRMASNTARFAGARLAEGLNDENITHVAIGEDRSRLRSIRETISR